jgi:hypothetical protein
MRPAREARVESRVRWRLTGHFTGALGSAKGTGQAIDFLAIDRDDLAAGGVGGSARQCQWPS